MSLLNIKQIAGPGVGGRAPTGAIPVFDGNSVRWSNNATTALQLPTGSATQRPAGIAGLIRYNTDAAKLEAFENGAWNNVINPIKSFLDLIDAPKTYSGFGGKVLAVNAAGTGLEYIDASITVDKIKGTTSADAGKYLAVKPDGSGVQLITPPVVTQMVQRTFRFNYNGSSLDSANPVQDLPAGWGFTYLSASALRITHTMGKPPFSLLFMGYNATPDQYYARSPSGNANFAYKLSTQADTFDLNGLLPAQTAASSGAHVIVVMSFIV